MKLRIVLLSGPLAAGKSGVASVLVELGGFTRVRSGTYLANYAAREGHVVDRQTLQELGDRLDVETDYRWLIDDVANPAISAEAKQARWLVDAVRKRRQIEHFRDKFPQQILHVHLTADEAVLRERYNVRLRAGDHGVGEKSYETAIRHANEVAARSLQAIADLTIDTGHLSIVRAADAILNELA
jgi:cytidylate kinase